MCPLFRAGHCQARISVGYLEAPHPIEVFRCALASMDNPSPNRKTLPGCLSPAVAVRTHALSGAGV